jgi:hypothetical protein
MLCKQIDTTVYIITFSSKGSQVDPTLNQLQKQHKYFPKI